ncbi:hypothetical protein AAIG93_35545, partial [Pseudomonas aeruginosa]|uniref:hypothetical protein n=1 Tax=Pseudomonas aeruginosa TaxID=287 RepID=UPI0031B6C754
LTMHPAFPRNQASLSFPPPLCRGGADYSGDEHRNFTFWLSAGDEPGRKSGGGALCADCSVATLYQSD